MIRKLCKLNRAQIASNKQVIQRLVHHPAFYCSRCARVADERQYLCYPQALVVENDTSHGEEVADLKQIKRPGKKLRKALKKRQGLQKKFTKNEKKITKIIGKLS